MRRRPPRSTRTDTLFPYTTLFRSGLEANPDQPGATMLPEAAAANRPIFYAGDGSMRSLSEIRALFAAKLAEGGGTQDFTPARTEGRRVGKECVSQFSTRWSLSHEQQNNNHYTSKV